MGNDAPLLLDVSRLIWRRWRGRLPTGIDRVCLAYLQHFGRRAQAVVQHDRFRRILDVEASKHLFELLEQPDGFRSSLIRGALSNAGRWSSNGKGRLYLNIGHTGLNSPGFRDWIRAADVKPVYFVHDLIPVTHPEFCRASEAEKHRERMLTVLTTAAGVIGNSEVTLDELAAFAAEEGLPSPPSMAAWLGSEPLRASPVAHAPERPTFVTLGTIEARKNHILLLRVWSRLIDRLGSSAPRLLIIGQRGWEAEPVFDLLDRDPKLRGHVIELGNCSDAEIAMHLSTARALLFPSHVEGYGLPLIEALGLGVPVVASDLPVFREIAGPIPTYLSPLDSDAWEAAILDFCEPSSPAREEQVRRIESFRSPDWVSHFAAVEYWLADLGTAAQARQHGGNERLYG